MALTLIRLWTICQDKQNLLTHLQRWKLIPTTCFCKKCGGEMTIFNDSYRIDGWRWKCDNFIQKPKQKKEKCGARREFRSDTFFYRSKLQIFTILGFVNLWVSNASLTLICQQLEINGHTGVDWSSFCREVVLNAYIDNKMKLGGIGKTVEIDESKFGKRKYHRGHYVEGQWVFGGYERGSGRVFMVAVDYRDADTLLPIILDWIEPGTTIISDYWKAYDCLSRNGYEHLKVNHSLHFKDPETGAHSNSIEGSWHAAKSVASSSGRKKAHIPGNLAKYIFQKRCTELNLCRTEEFYKLAGNLYNSGRYVHENDDFTDDSDIEN